jgi:hypothetical protein
MVRRLEDVNGPAGDVVRRDDQARARIGQRAIAKEGFDCVAQRPVGVGGPQRASQPVAATARRDDR